MPGRESVQRLSSEGRIYCSELCMSPIPRPERLALVQGRDNPNEWWVAIDGKCVVGFSGESAKPRAERYYEDLSVIGSRAARDESAPADRDESAPADRDDERTG